MKKKIGIFGWKLGENSFGVTLPYLEFINMFGESKILGLDTEIDKDLDLVIIPGGADIDPARYNAIPGLYNTKIDPYKEYQETVLVPQYIEAGIPIFGICRGMQSIAVLFGADLVQNMYHETSESTKRYDPVHQIRLENKFSTDLNIENTHKVNSLHHQCVSESNFPYSLEVVGRYISSKKNPYPSTIEIIKHKELPIWGVQYHPEELAYDIISISIIEKLLKLS